MATGFFGKLPARGDFVTRGLPSGARPVVDRWLTRVLSPMARRPECWPGGGLRGLIAHGEDVLALLILPSRDAAGRHFMLAAIAPSSGTGQAQVDAWAEQVLPALTRAVEGDLDANDLIALLANLTLPAGGAASRPPLLWAENGAPQDPVTFVAQMAGA